MLPDGERMSTDIEEWQRVNWAEGLPLRSGPLMWGLVDASPSSAHYWDKLKEERRVYLKHCNECGAHQHPRRVVCEKCYGFDFAWRPASGGGVVYTKTTIEYANDQDLKSVVPYSLGIIMLDENVPLFTRIVSRADASGRTVSIGDRGTCRGAEFLGLVLPLFEVD
jgi:uncharacterized OB-fold protein